MKTFSGIPVEDVDDEIQLPNANAMKDEETYKY